MKCPICSVSHHSCHVDGDMKLSKFVNVNYLKQELFCVKLELECHKCNMPNTMLIAFVSKCLKIYSIIIV